MQKLTSIVSKFIISLFTAFFILNPMAGVYAATPNLPEAKISITFDDGFASTYSIARPILEARGIDAAVYVTPGYIEDGTTDDGQAAMTWPQVQSLQNDYGWEIGSHTVTHPELPTLTDQQIHDEVVNSKNTLVSKGLNVTSFATPFGAYDNRVLIESLKIYEQHRGFFDREALNTYPYKRSVIQVQSVENPVTVAQVKTWVDQAKTEGNWLVLVFHDVAPTIDPNYEYTTTTADFTEIADYVKNSGVKTVLPNHTMTKPGANLVTNSTFDSGVAAGWTTDNAAQVTKNTLNNGSYPSSTNSIQMQAGANKAHLFSGKMTNAGTKYSFETFVNANGLTSGELGFYMDEYDASGNWISGQWWGPVANGGVSYFTKLYQPTSTNVKSFSIQTYLTAGAVGTVYLDNYEIYNLAPVAPTPDPEPVPGSVNLASNGSFENLTSGWATDWTRSANNAFNIDSTSQGNAAANSVHLTANSTVAHLFSKKIAVTNGTTYLWKQYIKATSGAGEFGFYIDEYDSAGNWISGQWKGLLNASFTGGKEITYIPTNATVASVGLQYYATAGSSFNLYLDSVEFVGPGTTPDPVPGTPTLTLTATPATITAGQTATLTWSSQNTTSCTATGGWTGSKAVNGSEVVTPSATATYTLNCAGATASVEKSATVTVNPVTPTPVPSENVVLNPSFETVLGSFASNWTHDNTFYVLDTASAGNDGANSIKLNPNTGTVNSHLFSSLLSIDAASSYVWKSYISASFVSGEFGFYIDEYDSAGNWISGQWKGLINANFTGTKEFAYTPTSATVAQVRLQYYSVAGSNITLTLDSVSLAK